MALARGQPNTTAINSRWPWQVPIEAELLRSSVGGSVGRMEGAADRYGSAVIDGVSHLLVLFDDPEKAGRFAARMNAKVYDMSLPMRDRGW